MKIKDLQQFPETWSITTLEEITDVNPRLNKAAIPNELLVSFVPMPAVGAGDGTIDVGDERPFGEVKKGFTAFQEGDVLFAKITPCMENGKMAVVPKVKNGYGFGSTEFHVLRPKEGMDARYLFYFVSSKTFRGEAGHQMTGAVGQKRVPAPYLKRCKIPIAPPDQQKRIVAEIEKQFSRLDHAIASLKRVKANLKRYKASVLKAAVEGHLVKTDSTEWKRFELSNIGKWCGGGTPSKGNPRFWTQKGIPWVSPKDMKTSIIIDTEDHITEEAVKESSTNLVPKNSVLVVTRSGILRHSFPVAICSRDVTFNQDLKALQPAPEFDSRYIALALRAHEWEIIHRCTKAGTTVQSIEFPIFLRFEIPVPNISDQKLVVEEVNRRLSVVETLDTEVTTNLQRAERLRQAILGTAFSGQFFRDGDANGHIEGVSAG